MEHEENNKHLAIAAALGFVAGGTVVGVFSWRVVHSIAERYMCIKQYADAVTEYVNAEFDGDVSKDEAEETLEMKLKFLQQVYELED